MAIWTLLADRLVKWGKTEEEERLTGRAETRRTLAEWTAVLLSTFSMVILSLVVFLTTCTLILRALDAGLAPPGQMHWVDGDKYMMHVYCHGNKTDSKGAKVPTVLIEGGENSVEDGLWQFAENAVNNGSISRFCFVDRPGFAWVRIINLLIRKNDMLIIHRATLRRHLCPRAWQPRLSAKHSLELVKMVHGVRFPSVWCL